ncbi:hypothetical protein B0H17DRAFT_1042133 [Mycena rosella]|uniref:Uncharacterized protein n=1 Tax=Mycena rosella TaxID=1033263 RepID=A0AAD7DZ92_MYCRO|nr:hypothetical protein B0H17DRAFT_1042133 [Mycena rosella]
MTPRIAGHIPGVLDPQQPLRLLRRPSSTLSFATFDPRTASADHGWDMGGLSLNEELYRPKRVVIGPITDEGEWPRVIDICGQRIECSQDQWDIYKLDPVYDCHVRAAPDITVITMAAPKPRAPKQPLGKHRMSSAEPCPDMPPTKSFRREEEDEVADMIIDDQDLPNTRHSAGPGDRAKKFREEVEKNRNERREKSARRVEKLGTRDDIVFDFSTTASSSSSSFADDQTLDSAGKRKGALIPLDSLRTHDDPEYYARPTEENSSRNAMNYSPTNASKRTRTFSPGAAKRDLETRRLEREKQKQKRREQELNDRRQKKYQHFLNEIYSQPSRGGDANHDEPPTNYEYVSDGSDSGDEEISAAELDVEAERMASIAESRRKLAELEADRPLWEQEAKKRERLEKEEQEAQRSRTAERRAAEARKAEQERRDKLEREQQQAQAKEEARARGWEERARREREKRQRNERWSYGPWTTQRALERYKTLSDIFDSTKFSPDDPLTFDAVPWPVLHSPVSFSVEDVDWAAVEGFYAAVKPHMRSQDFVSFVEKSHRRFHPDRWRSRGLLKSVADEADRGCLEVAANTVAQALTPLWRDLTGR